MVSDESHNGCSGSTECDRISYPGENGTTLKILIKHKPVQNTLRSDFSAGSSLFPNLSGEQSIASEIVLSQIDLANGAFWKFVYNPYAEISKVVLPTGGAIEYDHGAGTANAGQTTGVYASGQVLDELNGVQTNDPHAPWRPFIYRRLLARREYNSVVPGEDGTKRSSTAWKTSTYAPFETVSSVSHYPSVGTGPVDDATLTSTGAVTAMHTAGGGSILESRKFHDLQGLNTSSQYGGSLQATSPATTIKFGAQSTGAFLRTVPDLYEGKEYHTETGSGGTPLRIVDRAFNVEQQYGAARVCQQNTTYQDSGSITSTVFTLYDRNLSGDAVAVTNPFGVTAAFAYPFGNLTD